MKTTTPPRGARLYIELDEELTAALDHARKDVRLKRKDFIRWKLAQQLLGTLSLTAIAIENAK